MLEIGVLDSAVLLVFLINSYFPESGKGRRMRVENCFSVSQDLNIELTCDPAVPVPRMHQNGWKHASMYNIV